MKLPLLYYFGKLAAIAWIIFFIWDVFLIISVGWGGMFSSVQFIFTFALTIALTFVISVPMVEDPI